MKRLEKQYVALSLMVISLLMAGCIPVKNVQEAWNNAKADQTLIGTWAAESGDGIVGFVKTDKNFLVTSGTSGLEGGCRSIETHGHKYIIVAQLRAAVLGFDNVDDDTKDGTLIRYEIKGDTLTLYTYNQENLNNAVKNNQVKGELDENDSASLKELDHATIQWLGKIAGKKEGWGIQHYKRK